MEDDLREGIDELACRLESLIEENQEVLNEFDEDFTSFSEADPGSSDPNLDVDAEELFS